MAYRYIDRFAPFDVVNLDLCSSVTTLAAEGEIPNLEAIRSLCDVQIRRRGQPWLLFLTTRVMRENLDEQTKRKLFAQILVNIAKSPEFSSAISEELGIAKDSIEAELDTGRQLDEQSWFRAYVLALSKWLLQYMMGSEYSIAVNLLPSYAYGVHAASDMVSLAYLMEPVAEPRQDASGLTKPRSQTTTCLSESDFGTQIIRRISEIEDLDHRLDLDRTLKVKMFTKCAKLLATLQYDLKAYKTFALAD
ncbi:MAG: hypothetical protein HYV26_04020 [Candidatus Hydrogenedentes bacterium]|nr:hypothetical protein [Candidatus Hydrogenedentota bacterium]